ncbi:WD40 repeat domain-containing protein [Nonomuraea sp. NPDC049419]|uniref:WD40 repeat domain-containing protein n=1 Tax=Nonomuraea sp. NPDC049419 TaxID=3155772 RepID=UPI00342FB52D
MTGRGRNRAGRPERPVDPDSGPVARFAGQLRQLREEAGTPSYQVLGRKAHYAASTLAAAAKGDRLPSLEVTLAYVAACGGDEEEWRVRWQAAADAAAGQGRYTAGPCPYPGLAPFTEQDAPVFFGRQHLADHIREELRRPDARGILAVFGASGSGKSSLLRAGVLPSLGPGWRHCLLTPGDRPAAALETALAETGDDQESRLVVAIDQFEEIFTLCADPGERESFLNTVAGIAGDVRVLITVRADFYPHCSRHPRLVTALREGTQIPLGPPSPADLHAMITRPAGLAGVKPDGDLVATLLAEAADQPGALPMLAHCLRQTWHRRTGTTLRLADYRAVGGLRGAIAQTAEEVYVRSDPAGQLLLRDLFVRLTALGDDTEDTRRRMSLAELHGWGHGADVERLLDELARARLVVVQDDTVEVAHEAVISAWPRLRRWLDEDREALRVHRQLTEAATAWERLGRDKDALYGGTRLALARRMVEHRATRLNAVERGFLEASVAASRRRSRRARQSVAAMAVLLVLALCTTALAVREQRAATRQRNVAVAEQVAEQAAGLRGRDPALAAQLSLAAFRLAPTTGTRGGLLSALPGPHATRLTGHEDNVTSVAYVPGGGLLATSGRDRTVRLWDVADPHQPRRPATLTGHTDVVNAVAASPDGRTIASAGWDDTVRLWDVADPRRPRAAAVLGGHTGDVNGVAFSPGGRLMASASTDRTVRVWDVARPWNPEPAAVLTGSRDTVVRVAFSRDGRTLGAVGWDRTLRLWRLDADGRAVAGAAVPTGHTAPVGGLAFSPDGRTLATSSADRTARLWDVAGLRTRHLATMTGHRDSVRSVAFGAGGRLLATAGLDYDVRLWDLSDRRRPWRSATLSGHSGAAVSAAFSPDGRVLATSGDDHTVRLWDLATVPLTGHRDLVSAVAFSPDGRLLASGGSDHTVRLQAADGTGPLMNPLTGHTGHVNGLAFRSDGRLLASAAFDGTVRLWDLTDPRHPEPLTKLTVDAGHANAVAFRPDGRVLATAGSDAVVRLWDVTDPRHPAELAELIGHTDGVNAVVFRSDGRLLASSGWDRSVRLWDVTDPRRPTEQAKLTGHTDGVNAVALSPDGRTLATAGFDGTAILWDLLRPRRLATLALEAGTMYAVAFAAEGRVLATAGADGMIRLWDPAAPRSGPTAVLSGHTDRVHAVAAAARGSALASAGADRTVRLWDVDPGRAAAAICDRAHPRLTHAEWRRYFPDVDFRSPCP